MTEKIQVKCGQCHHFTRHNEDSVFGDNGFCSQWEHKLKPQFDHKTKSCTRQDAIAFYSELGGIEFHDDLLRECGSFTGKYSFAGGKQ